MYPGLDARVHSLETLEAHSLAAVTVIDSLLDIEGVPIRVQLNSGGTC